MSCEDHYNPVSSTEIGLFTRAADVAHVGKPYKHQTCFGTFDSDCTNVATLDCSDQPCKPHPTCEPCAQRNHSIQGFRHHALFHRPNLCMADPITKCNNSAKYVCPSCSDLKACEECLEKQHRIRPTHRNLITLIPPLRFRHAAQLDAPEVPSITIACDSATDTYIGTPQPGLRL